MVRSRERRRTRPAGNLSGDPLFVDPGENLIFSCAMEARRVMQASRAAE